MTNKIVLCEIFNSKKYGIDENSDKNIDKHYIVIYSYKYKGIKSFLDIKKDWNKKKKALRAYKTEIKKFPNSRSLKGIEILSKFRGVQNGLEQAEAFQVLKEINR